MTFLLTITPVAHACRAVSEALTIAVAKDWHDRADAIRLYARRAKNRQMEVQAAEIRLRAELADRSRGLAAVPNQEFDAIIAGWRTRAQAENARVCVDLLQAGRRAQRRADAADGGTCSIDDLHALVREGRQYGCIYADPPWLFQDTATRGAAAAHYGSLSLEAISGLPIADLAADDAYLHLWIPPALVFDAQRVFDAWDFEYRAMFAWW